ncbi:MAG: ASKHA domain-containing protein [Alphaproteobacteria bacterium]
MTAKHKVFFTPSGKRGEFSHGSNLLDAARSLGVDIDSVCGGRGICGRCQVVPSEGEFAKFGITSNANNLTPWSEDEQAYQDKKKNIKEGRRLSCCAKVEGDIVIDIPADSQVHKQVVRKAISKIDIDIDPVVKIYQVNLRGDDIDDVIDALENQHDVIINSHHDNIEIDDRSVSAIVRHDKLIDVIDGHHDHIYGFAVDLGSTTISCNLVRLTDGEVLSSVGAMNPQIRFGEDLMSRLSYIMMNEGGEVEMTEVVRDTMSGLFAQSITDAFPNEDAKEITKLVVEAVIVGNPVMHHLFLGANPVGLGFAPFDLSIEGEYNGVVSELAGLNGINPNGYVYSMPCIAGHVGADAASVALFVRPDESETRHLIVDVGTNAEIIYGDKNKLFACSSPTGPALEGAQISSGQRAAPGAIERVRIDPETLEPRFQVIGTDKWSDEDGFNESVTAFGVTGICGSGILEVMAEMYLAGIISFDGIIDGDMAEKSDRIVANGRVFDYILHRPVNELDVEIRVTQGDVRAIQLAKGALWAGCKIMEDKYGAKCEEISLAGAFGSHIDIKYAMILGLIPDCDMDKVRSIGNAAGDGSRIALLNKKARVQIAELVNKIEKIETALEQEFQEYFVDAMAIPNNADPYTNLQQKVTLPPKKIKANGEDSDGGGRRRRRRG